MLQIITKHDFFAIFFVFSAIFIQKGSSTVCDRNTQKNIKNRKTVLKKRILCLRTKTDDYGRPDRQLSVNCP